MRKKFYLTLDTETCTLPFANEMCLTARDKQKIAIAKPLVYDIGWAITDSKGNIIKKENYLVQETFFVPNVFNTAYYRDKRPIYMDLYQRGLLTAKPWNEIISILVTDLNACDITAAYNACFDFKKAIPFTERYINALYSDGYNAWEDNQRKSCADILNGKDNAKNDEYLEPYFNLRDTVYPLVDLWGVACDRLINIDKYRNYCLERGLLTNSAEYFKTSAETSFQYLMNNYDFIEDHTALSDALIEAQILTKAIRKGKIVPQLGAFPFRNLGTTVDYVTTKKPKYAEIVKNALFDYIEQNGGFEKSNGYWNRIKNEYETLDMM